MWPTGVGHLRDYSSSSIIFSSFSWSIANLRIPSASLSTAIGSWLCCHRNSDSVIRSGMAFHFTGIYQLTLNSAFAFGQLFQQRRGDGQAVTASQFQNFANVTEACAHHDGFIAVLLWQTVDFADGNYARIFCRCVLFLSVLALYESRIRPTNGEIRKMPASAQARA